MRRRSTGISLACVLTAAGFAAAPADAATYCVGLSDRTGCAGPATSGTLGQQLQAAIDAAELSTTDDVIRLGAGRYDRAPSLSASTSATFYYRGSETRSAGTLAIEGTAPGVVLANSGTAADDETVEGRWPNAPLVLRDLTVEAPGKAARSFGIEFSATGSALERVSVVGPTGGATAAQAGYVGVFVREGSTTIRNSVLRGLPKALMAGCRTGGDPARVTVEQATVATTGKPGSAGSIDASCDHEPAPSAGGAQPSMLPAQTGAPFIAVDGSVLATDATLRTDPSGTIALSASRWDGPSTVADGSRITLAGGLLTAAPVFADAELRLADGSLLVDAGRPGMPDAAVTSGGDRDGAARVTDGDGDGSAVIDLGAYERPAKAGPAPTPTPAPVLVPAPTPGPTPSPTPPVAVPSPTVPPSTGGDQPPVAPGDAGPTAPGPTVGGPLTETVDPPRPAPAPFRLAGSAPAVDARGRITVKLRRLTATRTRGTLRLVRPADQTKKLRRRTLGSVSIDLRSGKTSTVRLPVSPAERAALRKKGATLVLEFTPRGSTAAVAPVTLRVRRSD